MKTKISAYLGAIYFTLFVALVLGGVALKRIWGMPEYMMLFHLPAAVFLVLAGMELKKYRQRSYEEEILAFRNQFPEPFRENNSTPGNQ
jgi:hypothetical protein